MKRCHNELEYAEADNMAKENELPTHEAYSETYSELVAHSNFSELET